MSRRRLTGKNTFSAKAETSGLEAYLDQLGKEAKKAIRPAAQAGTQAIYDRVKANVARLGRKTGNLDKSIYQVFSKSNSKSGQKAEYHVSWNHRVAPHGHLVEYGYLQRYQYLPNGMGPMVRAGMEGKPKPGRRATQAEKDAYYVTLPSPKHVPGRFFVRSAASSFEEAYVAAENVLIDRLLRKTK